MKTRRKDYVIYAACRVLFLPALCRCVLSSPDMKFACVRSDLALSVGVEVSVTQIKKKKEYLTPSNISNHSLIPIAGICRIAQITITLRCSKQYIPMKRILLVMFCLVMGMSLSAQAPQVRAGKFSVARDKQVYFSKGNLQYIRSVDTWQFAEAQYRCIGVANLGTDEDGNPMLADTIDLFGWGTGNNPTLWSYDCNDYNEFVDWGVNRICGDEPVVWRTLSAAEWRYLLVSRTNAPELRGSADIDGLFGMVVLPDDWASL